MLTLQVPYGAIHFDGEGSNDPDSCEHTPYGDCVATNNDFIRVRHLSFGSHCLFTAFPWIFTVISLPSRSTTTTRA